MNITRRDALMGATAAAAVTGLTVAPLAMKAAGVKMALAAAPGTAVSLDPEIDALVNELGKHCARLDENRVEVQAALQLIPADIREEYDAHPGGPACFPDYNREYAACGAEALDEENDKVCDRISDTEARIIQMPVRTLGGLLKKVRVAWHIAALDYDFDEVSPDLSGLPRLDDCVAIWAVLQDLERLAGGTRS